MVFRWVLKVCDPVGAGQYLAAVLGVSAAVFNVLKGVCAYSICPMV